MHTKAGSEVVRRRRECLASPSVQDGFQVHSHERSRYDRVRVLELTLAVREVVRSTPRTRIIKIDLAGEAFPFAAGQAVFAGLASGSVRRPYSIACSPAQSAREDMIELLVQIDDHEAPDPHLELVEPGTLMRIQGPFGNFALPPSADAVPLLFIAGGTGIAPLRSMIWDMLERVEHSSLSLLYSARSPSEFAYAEELLDLAARRRLKLLRTITRDTSSDWDGTRGRLNSELIGSMLTPDTRVVICGPAALVADASAIAKTFGVSAEHIFTETYAA